uniref:Uncharacterized protein n=1 Tax=Corvus moneduloides TaxID=1196302 RepID=A0A8U7NM21_CORMO
REAARARAGAGGSRPVPVATGSRSEPAGPCRTRGARSRRTRSSWTRSASGCSVAGSRTHSEGPLLSPLTDPRHDLSLATPPRTCSPAPAGPAPPGPASGGVSSLGPAPTGAPSPPGGPEGLPGEPSEPDPALERRLLLHLSDLALPLPTDAGAIRAAIAGGDAQVTLRAVESLLHKFAAQELIEVRRGLLHDGPTLVTFADHSKLSAMTGVVAAEKRRAEQDGGAGGGAAGGGGGGGAGGAAGEGKEAKKSRRAAASDVDLEIESLLSQQSTKEQQSKKVSQEILELLNTTTAKEQSIVEKFRSRGRAQVQEFCDHGTKEECVKASGAERPCRKLHFRSVGAVPLGIAWDLSGILWSLVRDVGGFVSGLRVLLFHPWFLVTVLPTVL